MADIDGRVTLSSLPTPLPSSAPLRGYLPPRRGLNFAIPSNATANQDRSTVTKYGVRRIRRMRLDKTRYIYIYNRL